MLDLARVKVAKKVKRGGAFWRATTYEELLRDVGPNTVGDTCETSPISAAACIFINVSMRLLIGFLFGSGICKHVEALKLS